MVSALTEPGRKLLVCGPRRMGKTSTTLQAIAHINESGRHAFQANPSTASTTVDIGNKILPEAARVLGKNWKDYILNSVLATADEQMERKYALQAAGLDLDRLTEIVVGLTGVKPSRIFSPGKDRSRVYARSLLCFWANRELGISLAELSRRTRISQSSISMSVQRGEQIFEKEGHSLFKELKL